MKDCLFCKIVKNEIPSEKVFEDDDVLAFKDISPQAPIHLLIIPKKHIDSAKDIGDETLLAGKLVSTAVTLADRYHLDMGYRILTNVGEHGGQTVKHLHFHLLGGRTLNTTMG